MARPEGQRCLVEAAEGQTTSRLRSGALLHRFSSALPSGSRHSGTSQARTLLDCIFQEVRDICGLSMGMSRESCAVMLHRFSSALPSSSRHSGASQARTLLDCIFQEVCVFVNPVGCSGMALCISADHYLVPQLLSLPIGALPDCISKPKGGLGDPAMSRSYERAVLHQRASPVQQQRASPAELLIVQPVGELAQAAGL